MSNTNPPSDPASSLSAADLRRRLLASMPPVAAPDAEEDLQPAAEPEATDEFAGDDAAAPTVPTGGPLDLLARLRMPGKSGPVPVPAPRQTPTAPLVPQVSGRVPVNRRTPTANGRLDGAGTIAGALNQLAGYGDHGGHEDIQQSEIQRLKGENKELRSLLKEMKHLLQEASDNEQEFAAKEKEFAEKLATKDAQIEELSTHLGAIEEQIAKGELAPPPPVPKTRTELEEWSDELEKESAKLQQDRKRLEDDRRQLREDEEALEKQMREMEVAMARERALLARQETELRRLNTEIQHELELMQRGDTSLREQMTKFQRRAQEVLTKPPGTNNGRR
jgi:hypothetical protein